MNSSIAIKLLLFVADFAKSNYNVFAKRRPEKSYHIFQFGEEEIRKITQSSFSLPRRQKPAGSKPLGCLPGRPFGRSAVEIHNSSGVI